MKTPLNLAEEFLLDKWTPSKPPNQDVTRLLQIATELAREVVRLSEENAKLLSYQDSCQECEGLTRRFQLAGNEGVIFCNRCVKELYEHEAPILRTQLASLEKAYERLKKALNVVAYVDRSRGYPTGSEWMEVMAAIKEALREAEAMRKGEK